MKSRLDDTVTDLELDIENQRQQLKDLQSEIEDNRQQLNDARKVIENLSMFLSIYHTFIMNN